MKNDKITVVRNEVKAMTMRRSSIKDNSMMLRSIEEVVPKDHLVRKLERSISWDFIYEEVEDLYAPTGRRRSIR